MSDSKTIRLLPNGERVVLTVKDHHAKDGQSCIVIGALPNPSGRPENQWYDVRFDDNSLGRFPGRHLAPAIQAA